MSALPTLFYEDNFGYYDVQDDEMELKFLIDIRTRSNWVKCKRCHEKVLLLPDRTTCASCCDALEYGG